MAGTLGLHRGWLILQCISSSDLLDNHRPLDHAGPTAEGCRETGFDASMKTVNYVVENMATGDWEAVREIYQEGIATGNATVETQAPPWEHWNNIHRPDCRLVAKVGESVIGWAALSPVSPREAYAGVAEVSVYVAELFRGNGVGKLLLSALVSASEAAGVWTLQASIFVENEPSIAIHSAQGFRTVGIRERIGCLDGHWRNTVLMERRSKITGV